MTIERRVEVFGIPVKSKKLPIGSHEVFSSYGENTLHKHPRDVKYEDVVVTSPESLLHRIGNHKYIGNLIGATNFTEQRYNQHELNEVDIEKSIIPGIRVVYRWTPTPKSEAA